MNAQQIFDTVATHLITQGVRSETKVPDTDIEDRVRCCYRGPNSLMCAVGCLIPDEAYHDNMEDRTAESVIGECAADGEPWAEELEPHADLLSALQSIHDREKPEDWPFALSKLANTEGLTMPQILQDALQ